MSVGSTDMQLSVTGYTNINKLLIIMFRSKGTYVHSEIVSYENVHVCVFCRCLLKLFYKLEHN